MEAWRLRGDAVDVNGAFGVEAMLGISKGSGRGSVMEMDSVEFGGEEERTMVCDVLTLGGFTWISVVEGIKVDEGGGGRSELVSTDGFSTGKGRARLAERRQERVEKKDSRIML